MSARGLRVEATRDRHRIEAFLRQNAAMHVYALADLDDELWPQTRWWIALDGDRIRAVCLLLEALHVPLFYLVCPPHDPAAGELLRAVRPELPGHFFFNLGEGLREVLAPGFSHVIEGRFVKMILFDPRVAARVDPAGVDPLGPGDFAELQRFYANDAYAEDESDSPFFEPYMLASGAYRCIREQGRLVCVAGVHVQSPRMGVAALGCVETELGKEVGFPVAASDPTQPL